MLLELVYIDCLVVTWFRTIRHQLLPRSLRKGAAASVASYCLFLVFAAIFFWLTSIPLDGKLVFVFILMTISATINIIHSWMLEKGTIDPEFNGRYIFCRIIILLMSATLILWASYVLIDKPLPLLVVTLAALAMISGWYFDACRTQVE